MEVKLRIISWLILYINLLPAQCNYKPSVITRVGEVLRGTDDHARGLFKLIYNVMVSGYDTGLIKEVVANEKLCFHECVKTDGCVAINHHSSTNKCLLFSIDRNTAPDSVAFQTGQSGWLYADTGFNIRHPAWLRKSLQNLQCTSCNSIYECIKEPVSGETQCSNWAASGQLRYKHYCLRANTPSCSYSTGLAIEITDECNGQETLFDYSPEKGYLWIRCSNHYVCADSATTGQYLRARSSCSVYRWDIGIFGELISNGYCMSVTNEAKAKLVSFQTCTFMDNLFTFPYSAQGRVRVEVFLSCGNEYSACFSTFNSKEPDYVRNVYNFEIPLYQSSWMTQIGFRMTAYFVSPQSGSHKFWYRCNHRARIYFGETPETKSQIYYCSSYSWIHGNTRDLVGGKKYYFEMHCYEYSGYIQHSVGITFPNGIVSKPVTQKYLIAYP